MPGRLDGKVAVITGATSGIGEATARRFVAEGARVVIAGRSEERGHALASELGENAVFHRADVMHEAEIAAVIDAAVGRFDRLDCLFNNAGASTPGEIDTITEDQFDYGMKLLVGSVMFGIKHGARVMQSHGGSIINNSSIAAHRLGQGGTLYSAAKAAVSHITRIAGAKFGPNGIRVNAISPGAIATPIFWGGSAKAQTLSAEDNARKFAKLTGNLARATPLPRSGMADDIAFAAVFLASD
ncbi:MAG TPA: SDR family oxidoreductase, partial [Steroidobacteraceae bacterium]